MKLRLTLALMLSFAFAAEAGAQAPRAQIDAALKRMKTASGDSVFDRLKDCGIRITDAYMDSFAFDSRIGAKAGDLDLELMVDFPKPPWFEDGRDSVETYKNMYMSFYIHAGKPVPVTGWAKNILETPVPLAGIWMNC